MRLGLIKLNTIFFFYLLRILLQFLFSNSWLKMVNPSSPTNITYSLPISFLRVLLLLNYSLSIPIDKRFSHSLVLKRFSVFFHVTFLKSHNLFLIPFVNTIFSAIRSFFLFVFRRGMFTLWGWIPTMNTYMQEEHVN